MKSFNLASELKRGTERERESERTIDDIVSSPPDRLGSGWGGRGRRGGHQLLFNKARYNYKPGTLFCWSCQTLSTVRYQKWLQLEGLSTRSDPEDENIG